MIARKDDRHRLVRGPLLPHALSVAENGLYEAHVAPHHKRFLQQGNAQGADADQDGAPWLVVATNAGRETRAMQGLRDAGFATMQMLHAVEIRVGPKREKRTRDYPLYPGYLFVRPAKRGVTWHSISGINGVRTVICTRFTEEQRLPGWVTHAALMRLVIEADVQRQRVLMPPVEDIFSIGDTVMITEGPFADFSAIVERLLGKDTVEVAVSLFGRSTGLQISRATLGVVER